MRAVNFLSRIVERKRGKVESLRAADQFASLRERALSRRAKARPHLLRGALEGRGGVAVIAEFKRASPSKGLIRPDAQPAEIALDYLEGGAAAVSVITEEDFFGGSLDDLRAVRAAVPLPVLRKDFIVHEYQLHEAADAGADAVLLIVAALDSEELRRLRRIAEEELGMDALVEAHTARELRLARECGATLVGVNNRDLQTFEVSLRTSIELAREASAGELLVCESGLRDGGDLRRLRELGYRGFLIGETLMRAEHPGQKLREILREAEGLNGDTRD